MTVQNTPSFVEYTADGIQTSFNFTFRADDTSWVIVNYLVNFDVITLNLDQDASPGGSVSYTVPPPDQELIRIERAVPASQELNYTRYDPFDSESHEGALDKLTMILQDQVTYIDVADMNLQAQIDQEVIDRAAADVILQANIDAETAARIAGDAANDAARIAGDAVNAAAIAANNLLITTGTSPGHTHVIADIIDYVAPSGTVPDGVAEGNLLRWNNTLMGWENTPYLFPAADGGAGEVLTTDGFGNITFAAAGGGGTIGGSIANNQIAVGSGVDTIGGSADLTIDGNFFTIANLSSGILLRDGAFLRMASPADTEFATFLMDTLNIFRLLGSGVDEWHIQDGIQIRLFDSVDTDYAAMQIESTTMAPAEAMVFTSTGNIEVFSFDKGINIDGGSINIPSSARLAFYRYGDSISSYIRGASASNDIEYIAVAADHLFTGTVEFGDSYRIPRLQFSIIANSVTVDVNQTNACIIDIDDAGATGNFNVVLTAPAAGTGYYMEMVIEFRQGSPAFQPIWPGSVRWPGGTAPTLSTTVNDIDVVHLWTADNGVNWQGSSQLDYS